MKIKSNHANAIISLLGKVSIGSLIWKLLENEYKEMVIDNNKNNNCSLMNRLKK